MKQLLTSILSLAAIVSTAFLRPSASAQSTACESDINGDGIVSGADLTQILSGWGACSGCAADINGDNLIDGIDLSFVLARWAGLCAPTVTSMSASAGPLGGGASVTILGDHLLTPTSVTFGGVAATIVSSTRNTVTVLTPARRPGAVAVLVTTEGGSVPAGVFTYYGAPILGGVSPNIGAAVGGSVVSITGTGFYGSPSVSFGGIASPAVSLLSPTQLTAVAPAGAAGSSVSISVSTASGSVTSPGAFTYVAIMVPPWATMMEAAPDPAIVTSATIRDAIVATGYAWRVRDNGTGIEMVLIPPGSFNMGCSASMEWSCLTNESPVHSVAMTNAFYLGRFEVTQAQWSAKMGSNPSSFQSASPEVPAVQVQNRPVERVSWNAIQGFMSASGMRLPSEAEWEYAYRAGTTTAFHGFDGYPEGTNNDALAGSFAWYGPNSGAQTRPVGEKLSNGFGLHDMAGNVWEWVNDWYSSSYYVSSPSTNPIGPVSGSTRVVRGASWYGSSIDLRSSFRGSYAPSYAHINVGFRVARSPL
ncbi:MAG: SUMF1/EgtB/PvdO family nonheme iron enzyme [Planctomycetaceae bacterium]|nr:SUMF1/EgtB/PvdO family nonheme iron enzyme [Planctomycetaceae bacterium]